MATDRKYPVGIQTFSRIICEGFIYIDKTDLIWELANYATYVFMSRPRRFGKSLLTSTLEAYFSGQKDLFRGLKIMELEHDWEQYPVIHLDMSVVKGKGSADELRRAIVLMLTRFDCYQPNALEVTPGEILEGLIRHLYKQTGRQVVVIIDEYDSPLLDVLHEDEVLEAMRAVMQEFYQPLKAREAMIKFCFITGITKFSQLSIFSTINNLKNVSLNPRFSAICGITDHELQTVFAPDLERMAKVYSCTPHEMYLKFKDMYDGYHFAHPSEDIYNPYSVLSAFADNHLTCEWFASGTPRFLIRQMKRFGTDITNVERIEVMSTAFDQPTDDMDDALPLLYQTGYLTIKDYDLMTDIYTLAIPNTEVRMGYARGLIPAYLGLKIRDTQGFTIRFWRALKSGNIDLAMREMQAYLASLPYIEGFKQKLQDVATVEGFYEYTFYLIFSSFNELVRTQVKCAHGRTDMVIKMPDAIYVMELKVHGTAQQALDQINERGYAVPYLTDGRRVVKVGIAFDLEQRTVAEWVTECQDS